jgi:hypothetical protein
LTVQSGASGAITDAGYFDFDMDTTFDAVTYTNNATNGIRIGPAAAGGAVGNRSHGQIGHGGFDADGDHSGTIDLDVASVTVGTGLVINGGAGSNTYGMLGHGGEDTDGNHSGDIHVDVGFVIAGLDDQGPIGFGNDPGTVGTGSVLLTGGTGTNAFTQIGHGGANVEADDTDGLSGLIYVDAADDVTVQGGAAGGTLAYAAIGHQAPEATLEGATEGLKTGKIIVDSRNGDILAQGGLGTAAYGQIGHGGLNSDGNINHDGTGMSIVAENGNIDANGGGGNDSYGMIGSGDGAPYSSGLRAGNIFLHSNGGGSTDGGGTNAFGVRGSHRTVTAGGIASETLDRLVGNQVLNLTDVLTKYTGSGYTILNTRNLAGEVSLTLPAGAPAINVNNTFNLSLVTEGDLFLNGSIQQQGTGDVNLVVGWDGLTGDSGVGVVTHNNCPPFTSGVFT